MTITKNQNGTSLKLSLEGRLDTITSPLLETELNGSLDKITELVLDFEKLEYISSAGLRVLLSAQKAMNRQGEMRLTGVSESVRDVFDITGFSDILTITD